jgi:hypothetical protein
MIKKILSGAHICSIRGLSAACEKLRPIYRGKYTLKDKATGIFIQHRY